MWLIVGKSGHILSEYSLILLLTATFFDTVHLLRIRTSEPSIGCQLNHSGCIYT